MFEGFDTEAKSRWYAVDIFTIEFLYNRRFPGIIKSSDYMIKYR